MIRLANATLNSSCPVLKWAASSDAITPSMANSMPMVATATTISWRGLRVNRPNRWMKHSICISAARSGGLSA